jgi:E3 ubiquitin-protein ligase RNF14
MASVETEDERVDELTTLQSIYPELAVDLSNPAAPTALIELAVAPIDPLPIVFQPESPIHRLSHLPPLLLEIILHEGYPAERAPTFHLATSPQWLPNAVLEQLEHAGRTLWEEYGGMPMLFAYISYLQERAETAFQDTDSLPDGVLKLSETIKDAMLELNEQREKEVFQKQTFDCGVCLDPKSGSVCYRIRHCGHVFCIDCLQDYYNNCIQEGDVNHVTCLDPGCGKTGNVQLDRKKKPRLLTPVELLRIPLSLDTVTRYVHIKRKKILESDPEIAFCPRQWCQGAMRTEKYPKPGDISQMDDEDEEDGEGDEPAPPPARIEEETREEMYQRGSPRSDRLVVCEDCNLAFCRVCLRSWHGDLVRCITRNKDEISQEDQASLDYILQNCSPCPTCSAPTQKMHGCNHMTCFQCKNHFCYICGAWLPPDSPYRHFNDPKIKSCFQKLFDGALPDGDHADGQIRFAGRRGAEQQAAFWEQEALRIQMEVNEAERVQMGT